MSHAVVAELVADVLAVEVEPVPVGDVVETATLCR